MSKIIELKQTTYQIFEVDDDNITPEDIEKQFEDGTLLMSNPHTAYLDAQIVNNRNELDGNYINIF